MGNGYTICICKGAAAEAPLGQPGGSLSLRRMELGLEVSPSQRGDLSSFLNGSRPESQTRHMVLTTDCGCKQLHPVVLFNFQTHRSPL